MSTAPERAEHDKSKTPPLTRFAQRQKEWVAAEAGRVKENYQAAMPPLGAGESLVAALFRIGPTMIGAMGSGPITHGEIESWQHNTGVRLSGREADALHTLSIEYLAESQAAAKRDREAPWAEPDARPPKTAFQLRMAALREL